MNETVVLNGENLTIDVFNQIVREGVKIEIHPDIMEKLVATRKLVFDLADRGIPIYGFTVGVGWNKDKRVFGKYFEDYNRNLIYAHCVAVDPEASEETVRAAILGRLGTFLACRTGVQPEVVIRYADFLNRGIHPVMPERGSVGQGDIACMSHLGLAVMGEGDVYYKGQRVPAKQALAAEGLFPVTLGPKDGLAIVSSSGLSMGKGALVLKDIRDLIEAGNKLYALSLEGLNGNITPLNSRVNEVRKMPGQIQCAKDIRAYLSGSYLGKKDITKTLQDPLSYRDVCALHGSVLDALEYVERYMEIHLNTTEDNPCVLLEDEKIVSCQNFEIPTVAMGLEMLAISLSHVSKASCLRTIKLSTPVFTGLPRFLSPNEGEIQAYQTIQKPFTSLDTEIRHLANPTSMDRFSVAGDIEDTAYDAPYVVRRLEKILDNLYYIFGLEAMHAVQAIDLREGIELGVETTKLYHKIREVIPFVDKDRPFTPDIKSGYELFKSKKFVGEIL